MNCLLCNKKMGSDNLEGLFVINDPQKTKLCDRCTDRKRYINNHMIEDVIYRIDLDSVIKTEEVTDALHSFSQYTDGIVPKHLFMAHMRKFYLASVLTAYVLPGTSTAIDMYRNDDNKMIGNWLLDETPQEVVLPIENVCGISGFFKHKIGRTGVVELLDKPNMIEQTCIALFNFINVCRLCGVEFIDLIQKSGMSPTYADAAIGCFTLVENNVKDSSYLPELMKLREEVKKARKRAGKMSVTSNPLKGNYTTYSYSTSVTSATSS